MTFVGGHGLQGHLFTGQSRVAPGARVCPVRFGLVSGSETRLPWGVWGTSDVLWVTRVWVSGKTCLLASLQGWLSRRQHLCSNLTAAALLCCVWCCTVVLCVLLLSSLLLCSVAPPASLAGAYFSCTVGKVFKFCKKSSYHKIKYLSSLSHCSVILCCLLQSL